MSAFVFRNYGGIEQLRIADAEDLERIDTLDEARWAATSAPIAQLFCDPAFLAYVDTDANGRIRVDELKEARQWLWARLRSRARLSAKSDELRLSDLDPAHPEAAKVKLLAERLLGELGAAERDRIQLAQVRQFRASYTAKFPNGDGVLPPGQIPDAALADLARTVLATTGGAPDLSGAPGVRAADLDTWSERARAFVAWTERGADPAVSPLGSDTGAAAELTARLAPKIRQFFAQCALVALEPNAATRLQASPEELAKLDVSDAGAIQGWLTVAPLARPGPEAVLRLDGAINPHYAADVARFARDVAPRALGRTEVTALTAADLSAIEALFAPFHAWREARPAGVPADASPDALRTLADGPLPGSLRALCVEDERVGQELVEFNTLEKLVLYQRHLLELANNFVSFPALFVAEERTLFEMGTLILDGRRLNLCVRVTDRAAHKKIAETSLMFLAYVELVRKDGATEVKDQIAAAVTAGFRGGISVGKRGVFYDRDDREWDALVVDIVQNPISIAEAMIAPFVRIRDAVASRVATAVGSKATELETKVSEKADKGVTTAAATAEAIPATAAAPAPPAPAPAPPAPPKPPDNGSSLQTALVGGSLAFAAIGSSAAFVMKTVADIEPLDALVSVGILVVMMAGVFGLLGWLKLRRRDVSALLEACGWALNGRMRLTHYLSVLFTRRPGLPEGAASERQLPPNRAPWIVASIVLVLVLACGILWEWPQILGPYAHLVPGKHPADTAAPATPAAPAATPAAPAPAPAP